MRTGGHGFAQSILVDELSIPRVQDELDSRIIGFHLSYTQEGQIATASQCPCPLNLALARIPCSIRFFAENCRHL
jgi:hypothetical protein